MFCICGNHGPETFERGRCRVCWYKRWHPDKLPRVRPRPQPRPVVKRAAPEQGPGTELKKLLASIGINPSSSCNCAKHMREMNRRGVTGCRATAGEIVGWLREGQDRWGWATKLKAGALALSTGLALKVNWLDPFPGLVEEACRLAEESGERQQAAQSRLVEAAERESYAVPPRPHGASVLWAVGMTTVPERGELRERTLTSLEAAGWRREDVHLFLDGAQGLPGWPGAVCSRFPRAGAWTNWWLGLTELFHRCPGHDRFLMLQDDVVFVRNLRAYLEAVPFPEMSYLNLFSFSSNEPLMGGSPGFRKAAMLGAPSSLSGQALEEWKAKELQCGRGALALVFDRDTVRELLAHRGATDRPIAFLSGTGRTRIDGGLVTAMGHLGRKEFVHSPSLVQHTGHVSAIGNGNRKDAHGRRNGVWREDLARTFPGEDFDAATLIQAGVTT